MTELDPKQLEIIKKEQCSDPLIRKICNTMILRSEMGIIKYKNTMEDAVDKKTVIEFLDEAIEEGIDLVIYLEAAKLKIRKLIDEYRNGKTVNGSQN